MKHPRILLADDHVLVVDAFRRLLESTCEVVGTVGDGHALVGGRTGILKPDVDRAGSRDAAIERSGGCEATQRIDARG